ncbi:MAG: TIGR02996 domain-containing protein, partial [Myxococcales bacterium]|nr:TIGR02996 domain-containing protein [Myxococcales bacterium]
MEPIEAAMARGAWVEALDLALAAWRETRAPELAETIETLGPRAASQRLSRGDKEAFHAAWLALAAGRRACDLHPLLEGFARDAAPLTYRARIDLMQALPLEYSPERRMRVADQRFEIERERVLRERVAALRAFPVDPRISTAMLDLLRRAPWSGDDVYAPLLDLVVHTGDPRAATALERLHAEPTTRKGWMRRWLAQALPPAIAALRALPVERVAMATLSARSPTPSPTSTADEATLLAEVLAAPHDDGPREVLADFLLERQDPRGEFLTLQLAAARGTGTAKGLQRMGSLLRRHEAEWIGPLALVLSGREYRRGFL